MKVLLLVCLFAFTFASFNVELSVVETDTIKFQLKNNVNGQLEFHEHHTPLNGMFRPYFCITGPEGEAVEYYGPYAKFVTENMGILTGEEARETTIKLGDYYEFLSAGRHQVAYCGEYKEKTNVLELDVTEEMVKQSASSKLDLLFKLKRRSIGKANGVTFSGCDSTQQSSVNSALSTANSGLGEVNAWPPSSSTKRSLFTEWFGTFSTSAGSEIDGDFSAIGSNLAGDWIAVCNDAGCSPSVFAFVYPSDTSHNIYLCGATFAASSSWSQDSAPGVLVHEMSHFDDVADTLDHVYGPSGCRSLAISNPTNARDNADSHEYYCEFGIPAGSSDSSTVDPSSGPSSGPSSTPGQSSSSNSGIPISSIIAALSNCSAAEATNGTEMFQKLHVVRNFRDSFLADYKVGRRFIDVYYDTSNKMHPVLEASPVARLSVRMVLRPIIAVLELIGY